MGVQLEDTYSQIDKNYQPKEETLDTKQRLHHVYTGVSEKWLDERHGIIRTDQGTKKTDERGASHTDAGTKVNVFDKKYLDPLNTE